MLVAVSDLNPASANPVSIGLDSAAGSLSRSLDGGCGLGVEGCGAGCGVGCDVGCGGHPLRGLDTEDEVQEKLWSGSTVENPPFIPDYSVSYG